MARTASKIMTITEKKLAQGNLKNLLKENAAAQKALDAELALASKALAAAKKAADTDVAAANKLLTAATKKAAADVKVAEKVFAAAKSKHDKSIAAAGKGLDKLNAASAVLAAADAVATAKASSDEPAMA